MKETNIWGIHAGKSGNADELFLRQNRIGLGWSKVGDLTALPVTRDAYKERVVQAYPNMAEGAIPGSGGQLFRFMHEMKNGDLVAYPCKRDRRIYLGRVEGGYVYDPVTEPGYPHLRAVKWLRDLPREHFSQGALYEIGSALSFFLLKNFADEFRGAVDGKASAPPVQQDETVAAVSHEIAETTEDFIRKRLSQELKGLPFEEFIQHLLECMGYKTRLSRTNEASVDLIAHRDPLGVEPPIIKVQVKSGSGPVKDEDVSALYSKLSHGEYGLFVTLGSFMPKARETERSKANLRLIDGSELVELILEHYDQFGSRYKNLLPLRRIYVPDLLQESEG